MIPAALDTAATTLEAGAAEEAQTTLAVFSDRLNHASIIDAIRAQRRAVSHRDLYGHDDLDDLRRQPTAAPSDASRVIVTDGVFSMEGDQAPLQDLLALADEFDALPSSSTSRTVSASSAPPAAARPKRKTPLATSMS